MLWLYIPQNFLLRPLEEFSNRAALRSSPSPHSLLLYYHSTYVVYGSSSSRAAKSLRKGRIKEQSAAKLLRSAVLSLFFFFNFSWWAVSVAGTLLTLLNILWISDFDSVFGKRQNI